MPENLDNVETELALDRGIGHLALGQADQSFGKFFDVAAGVGPIQVAAIGSRAVVGVSRALLRRRAVSGALSRDRQAKLFDKAPCRLLTHSWPG